LIKGIGLYVPLRTVDQGYRTIGAIKVIPFLNKGETVPNFHRKILDKSDFFVKLGWKINTQNRSNYLSHLTLISQWKSGIREIDA